jgi:predicted ATPase
MSGARDDRTFFGRGAELEAVAAALARSRFVLLVGPGGAGKTRLARRVTRARDGASLFCDLSSVRTESDLVGVVGAALGLVLGGGDTDAAVEQIALALSARRALVVLDNLEGVPKAAHAIAAWSREGAHILGTSRVRLGVSGEEDVEVGPLAEADALALFAARARDVAPEFEPDEATRELVVRLAGSPLAIELAAARAHVLGPRALLARFSSHLDLLKSTSPALPDRHRSLRAVVEGSWALSSDADRRALAACSVFRGGFDLAAAEAVLGEEAIDRLESLLASSLVSRSVEGGEARFSLSDTVREYAAERLGEDAPRLVEVSRAHAEHYRALAVGQAEQASNAEPRALAVLVRETENLLGAFRVDGRSALAMNAVMHRVLPTDRHIEELTLARGRVAGDDLLSRAEIELALVRAIRRQGGAARAVEQARTAEEAAARTKAPALLADAAYCTSLALFDAGRVTEAREAALEGIRLAEAAGIIGIAARCHDLVGFCALDVGDFAQAARSGERVLAIARERGYRFLESFAENLLGQVHTRRGELAAARDHLTRGLSLVQAVGQPTQEAIVRGNLAKVLIAAGELDEARAHLGRARELCRWSGLRKTEAAHLVSLATLEADAGRLADARAHALSGERLAREVGHDRQVLSALLLLGSIGLEEGRTDDALADLERARGVADALESVPGRAAALAGIALARAALGDVDRAAAGLEAARRLAAHATPDTEALVRARAASVAFLRAAADRVGGDPALAAEREREGDALLALAEPRARTQAEVRIARRDALGRRGAGAAPPSDGPSGALPFEIVTREGAADGAALPARADLAFDAVERRAIVDGAREIDLRKKPIAARLLEVVLQEPERCFDKMTLYREVWHGELRDASQGSAVYKAVDRLARLLADDPRRFLRWDETGALALVAKHPALLRAKAR